MSLTREEFDNSYLERKEKIEKAVWMILDAVGEDLEREGIQETPSRVAKAWLNELCRGLHLNPRKHLEKVFTDGAGTTGIVTVAGIPFESLCEHHLLPFTGRMHIGYLPNDRIVGISKLARVGEEFAAKPQVQERLGQEIVNAVQEVLHPRGCGVVIEAVHSCMCMRGVRRPGSVTVTSEVRGLFENDPSVKEEFMKLIYPYRKDIT